MFASVEAVGASVDVMTWLAVPAGIAVSSFALVPGTGFVACDVWAMATGDSATVAANAIIRRFIGYSPR